MKRFTSNYRISLFIKEHRQLIDIVAILIVVMLVINYVDNNKTQERLEREAKAEKLLAEQDIISKKKKLQEKLETDEQIKNCLTNFISYKGRLREELSKKTPKQLKEHWGKVCASRYKKSHHNNSTTIGVSNSNTYTECLFNLSYKYTDDYATAIEVQEVSIRIRRECAYLK